MASFWISNAESRIQSFPRLYYMGRDIDHFEHKSWCIYYSLALVLIKSTGWLWFKYSFEYCSWPELSTLPDNPETPGFGPYFPVSSLESEIFGIITKICCFLWYLSFVQAAKYEQTVPVVHTLIRVNEFFFKKWHHMASSQTKSYAFWHHLSSLACQFSMFEDLKGWQPCVAARLERLSR